MKEILAEEKIKGAETDSPKTSTSRRMIPIVDDEELQKRKASCTPQNTQTNTLWAVCVWFEWAKESNDFIQIIGDNETIPHMKLIIFVDILLPKFEFLLTIINNYLLLDIRFKQFERRILRSSEKAKLNCNKL